VRAAKAATTLESTPPDMATTMRASAGERPREKRTGIGGALFTRNSPCLARPPQPITETRAGGLARHEGEFEAAAETSLELEELLRALESAESAADRDRQAAIACLLSASEGWREAVDRLGGAFADGGTPTGLTDGKDK
jgi:hypothetical protein